MQDNKYYLRLENNNFGFLVEGIHEIKETDIGIKNEEYNQFFELQSRGKQFKLKELPSGTGLFDYVEEYIPEAIELPKELEIENYILDLDYRLSMLELGGI